MLTASIGGFTVTSKTYDERKIKNRRRLGTRTTQPPRFLFLIYLGTYTFGFGDPYAYVWARQPENRTS